MKIEATKEALCLHSEIESREFAQSKLFSYIKEAGFLVRFEDEKPSISPWYFTETKEKNLDQSSFMSLIGPAFEGQTFFDILMSENKTKIRKTIYYIQRAFEEASLQNISLPEAGPMAILVSKDAVLFLPQELCLRSLNALSENKKNEYYGRFIHRLLKGEKSFQFTLSVYMYFYLTNELPFPELNEEKRQEQIGDSVFIPLALYNPMFSKELIEPIETILSGKKDEKNSIKLALLTKELAEKTQVEKTQAIKTEIDKGKNEENQIHESVEEKLKIERKEWIQKKQKQSNIKLFLKKQKFILLSSLIAILIIFLIIFSYIKDKKAEANSFGLSDIETIEAYYTAINRLDVSASTNLLVKRLKSPYTNLISTYHVVKVTRQTYELAVPFYYPLDALYVELHENAGLLGLTHLKVNNQLLNPFAYKSSAKNKIKIEGVENGERRNYIVSFYFIRNEAGDDLYIDFCEDTLSLIFYKDRWLIENIEQSSKTKLLSYEQFLQSLNQVSNLSAEDKLAYLKDDYEWLPSLEEIELIQSESPKYE